MDRLDFNSQKIAEDLKNLSTKGLLIKYAELNKYGDIIITLDDENNTKYAVQGYLFKYSSEGEFTVETTYSGNYAQLLKSLLEKHHEIENSDLLMQFAEEAMHERSEKYEAIKRLYESSFTSNPFDEGKSYVDLVKIYEDIIEENDASKHAE